MQSTNSHNFPTRLNHVPFTLHGKLPLQATGLGNIQLRPKVTLQRGITNGIQGGNCFDTSVRLVYRKTDSISLSNDFITKTKDGNILIPGYVYQYSKPYTTWPRLTKCTPLGDTIWSKKIVDGYPGMFTDVYHAFELADQSILLMGNLYVPMLYNGREDFKMVKVTANGNFIWEKTFKTPLWNQDTTNGSIDIYDCKQDSIGNIYVCGDIRHNGPPRQALVFKMDTDGNILWSKAFTTSNLPSFAGLDINGSKITVLGRDPTNGPSINILGYILDAATGDTLLSKTWGTTGDNVFWHSFYGYYMTKLKNGNLALYGSGASDFYNFDSTQLNSHYGIAELTPGLDLVNAIIFRSPIVSNGDNSKITVFDDGSAAFTRLNYISGYSANVIFGTYKNGQIVKERVIPYAGAALPWVSNFLQLDDGGQLITNFYSDSVANYAGIEVVRLHNSDTSGSCLGSDKTITTIEPVQFTATNDFLDSISSNVLIQTFRPVTGIINDTFFIQSSCNQVSYCDSLKLSVPNNVLCPFTPVNIHIGKNKACGANPLWTYDTTAVQFFTKLNDTTVSVSFKAAWRGYIKGSIDGCNLLEDSIKLTVLQAPAQLNLGPDTVICPNDTITLNAGSGYASYQWQDGSVDSIFKVTKPGSYYVTATNACGGQFVDTVVVNPHSAIPFNVGNDTSICQGDTLVVTAPQGFTNYRWSPAYNINPDTTRTVNLYPAITTRYYVSAQFKPGCFAYDSILITVKKVPAIHLGNDTSFCAGQYLTLDAGAGFDSYQWNTGANTQKITADSAGAYWVNATANGCPAVDTLKVLNVSLLPVFSLGDDTALCDGKQLHFAFNLPNANYAWNTGSIVDTFSIVSAGSYWLQVTQLGCSKTDTLIVTFKPSPYINLGLDSTLCEGSTLLLNAYNSNAAYLWQDGSTNSSYLVQNAGTYFVTAAINGCTAADTIKISYSSYPTFSLGPRDTTLCTGNHLNYAFNLAQTSYLWNTGSIADTFTITKPGTYWLTATRQGCGNTDTITVKYQPSPQVFLGKDTTLCQGTTILLNAYYTSATYTWQDGSTASTYLVNKAGTYSATVDLNECTTVVTIQVAYIPIPYFLLGRDTFICTGEQLVLSPVLNTAASYLWQDGSKSAYFYVSSAGTYTLTATNGCGTHKDSVTVTTDFCKLLMPTAFTPNMDGKNDVFKVKFVFPVKQFRFKVFNRWGQKIYETEDISQGWDGTFNGVNQPIGTYVWLIELIGTDGKPQEAHGAVTLIR